MTTARMFLHNAARRAQIERQRVFLRRLAVGAVMVVGWLASALYFGG